MSITTTDVLTTDTFDQGRVKINANDQALASGVNGLQSQQATHLGSGHPNLYYAKSDVDSQQSAQDAALATHKTSGDHDARYLSASYLATLVRTTFNQTIDGIKNFLQNVLISNGAPTLELHDVTGNILARLYAVMGSPNILRLSIAENLAWKEVLEVIAGQSFVNFPNHDVASKGNRLATEAYVETYVQENPPASSSSIFVLERSIWIDPLPTVLPAQIVLMWPTLVPIGAVLTELRYSHFTEDQNVDTKESQCSIQFTDTLYNIVKVVFNIDAQWGVSLTVWATHVIIGGANDPPTWSPIKQITISENGTYMALGGAEGLSVTLRFGMAA